MRLINMAYLIQKRLFKKPSFIIILLIIPIAVASITAISKKDAGILKIAVYPGNINDTATSPVIDSILEHRNTLEIQFEDTASKAKSAVIHGQADCAWIFPDDFKRVICDHVDDRTDERLVSVYIREENIPTKLAGELLFGAVFPQIAKEIYLDFINNDLDLGKIVTEEELMELYNTIDTDTNIIRFTDSKGKETEKTGFLVSPIRGILSIFIMISSLASTMYFMKDSALGAFAIMPRRRRLFLLCSSVFFGALDCAAVSLISLAFTPLFTSVLAESGYMIVFVLTISAFSAFFSLLLEKPERIGAFMVSASIFVFAFCPVFFSLKVPIISDILPQTYYLQFSGKNNLLFEMLLFFGYSVLSVLLFYLTDKVKKK